MRISQICIDRPILATVMSLVIALVGLVSLSRLPDRYLPDIDPPVVSITTVLPGAAAEVVEASVTDPLEDFVNGIEGVKHVTSSSREEVSEIAVEFGLGRDLEVAASDVRDAVARARRELPEEAEDPIVAKRSGGGNPEVWLALTGEGLGQVELSTLAETRLVDRLSKLPGVANVMIAGERRYSMRVWIDNRRLAAQRITIADVSAALGSENVDIPSGRVESADTEFTVRSLGELRTVGDFENLIVANVDGQAVRLRDVAEVEVGPEDERKLVRIDGETAVGLGVMRQSSANILEVAEAVQGILEELRAELPPGVQLTIPWDGSVFIRRSIEDVRTTIFEATALVVLVIYLFLRRFRATLVPTVAIPVSILGAAALLYALGFTINTLTLMGVTLAIGLVVDDAIVVLENITRWVESGTPRLEAARQGMQEISFAVIAATVSAVAVFAPLMFLTDETGRLFREFAVTVAAALAVSGFVALTLSPALCARVLRQGQTDSGLKRVLAVALERLAAGYAAALDRVLQHPALALGVGVAWLALGVGLLQVIDKELMPEADRSVFFVWTQAPEGSTVEVMDRYQRQAEAVVLAIPEVTHTFSVTSLGFGAPGPVNQGVIFVSVVEPEERERSIQEIIESIRPGLDAIPGIQAYAFKPSALTGFATSPLGFVVVGDELAGLSDLSGEIARRMSEIAGFVNVESSLLLNKPQLEVEIDRDRASDLGISVRDVATTLQILLGGLDLSTFKLGGETYKVVAQLVRDERNDPRDLVELTVRGNGGELISLSALVRVQETVAPRAIEHFDRRRSATVSTNQQRGFSQGEGIGTIRAIVGDVLPEQGYQFHFTGDAERFIESGNAIVFAYALAVVVVFLVLAAQFESFVDPLIILVAVAFSFTGALVALLATRTTLNLFSQIGLVMLIGLVTKNSILIVEFANQLRSRGLSLVEATSEAARTRFRPILMTALATLVGILPIALGRGAGGEARAPLGIAVVGGVFFSTLLSFFLVPAAYIGVARASAWLAGRSRPVRAVRSEPAAIAGS